MSSSRLISRSVFASAGFTLVELLVAVAVSSVALTAAYLVFSSQQRAFYSQDQIAALQQNLRFSMNRLERDIRMIGFNPTGTAKTRIIRANSSVLLFTQDTDKESGYNKVDELCIDNEPDFEESAEYEQVIYRLIDGSLLRKSCFAEKLYVDLLAENIDWLDFVYLDSNNNVLDIGGTGELSEASRALVRSIQITLIAKTARRERDHVDNTVYLNGQGDPLLEIRDPSYKRRLVSTTVGCRNLWL